MKCEHCPALKTEGYEYPETYCGAGVKDSQLVEFQDGYVGCRYSLSRIQKKMERIERMQDRQYDGVLEYYQEMDDLEQAMEQAIRDGMKEISRYGTEVIFCKKTRDGEIWECDEYNLRELWGCIRRAWLEAEPKVQKKFCEKCRWKDRPQKCACCRRNRKMKDCYQEAEQ